MSVTQTRLRALNAVVQNGTYASAARALGVSQPAIAQQVRELEKAYSVHLFDRKGGVLHPTPLCSELCDVSERMSELEARAIYILTRQQSLKNGKLSVGLGNSMPGMALIAAFQRDHPGVSISVELGSHEEIVKAVLSRAVDVAVLPNVPQDSRFRRTLLIEQDVVAIVSQDMTIARYHEIDCAMLMRERLIFRARGSSTQRVVDRAFQEVGLRPQPALTLDTRDGVYEAVANGLGVGFMWRECTSRKDGVRCIPVREMNRRFREEVFALDEDGNRVLDAFFLKAEVFRKG